MKKIIFFQAHPDDLEFNCVQLLYYLSKLSKKSYEIKIASMTRGEFGTPDFEYDEFKGERLGKIRTHELFQAHKKYGIPKENVKFFNILDGSVRFNKRTIQQVSSYLKSEKPDIIFAPEPTFTYYQHPDHKNTGKIIFFIYYKKLITRHSPKIYFFTTLSSNFLWPFSKKDLKFAYAMISMHKSQSWMFQYMRPLYRILGRLYGRKISGWKYAEGYRKIHYKHDKTRDKGMSLLSRIIRVLSIKTWFIDESIYQIEN